MKEHSDLKTTALVVASCLSLGFASCSTTKDIPASSAITHPAPINNNSVAKDVADGAAGALGFVQQEVVWRVMKYPVTIVGGIGVGIGAHWWR